MKCSFTYRIPSNQLLYLSGDANKGAINEDKATVESLKKALKR